MRACAACMVAIIPVGGGTGFRLQERKVIQSGELRLYTLTSMIERTPATDQGRFCPAGRHLNLLMFLGASMTEVNIQGPTDLSGTVRIQGSKNAAQKLIPSTVAFPGVYTLYNVPDIHDSRVNLKSFHFLAAS